MANFNDIFAETILGGGRRGLLMPDTVKSLIQARVAGNRVSAGFPLTDPLIDNVWGGNVPTAAPHNYFDYFFSGQDITIYVDGTAGTEFIPMPIIQMGFNVQQQKQPVFGFWSYTYDAVMRGQRLIQGQLVMATKAPDYMRRLLSQAAQTRAQASGASYPYFKGLTEDDTNIQSYWGKNIDPAVLAAGKNVYSVHPPFSLVVIYGMQSMSVQPGYRTAQRAVFDRWADDAPIFADINERLVDSDPADQATRIILDACEITSMQTGYGADGQVVSETYTFFARDIVIPARDLSDLVPAPVSTPPPPNVTPTSQIPANPLIPTANRPFQLDPGIDPNILPGFGATVP